MNIEQMGQLLNIQVTDQPEEDVVDMLDRNRDRVVEGNIIRGSIKSHKLNASIILENDSRMATRFRYNEFNDQIYINGENYEDEDTTEIELWLHRVYSVQIAKEKVNDLIIRQAKNNSFHPLQDYLNSLEWDGVCRLETLLQTYWGVFDSDLLREIGFRWAISCVARALMPGAKMDTVLILCGPQGAYKSTSFRVLAGEDWFTDGHLDISKKDAQELIHKTGVWVWEMAENNTLNKAESNTSKEFLSRPIDIFRPSYGRNPVRRPRSIVFVSTTNDQHFLTDKTGNRRFWPVIITDIDLEGLQRDRDQIWAEAVHYFNTNEVWWLDPTMEQDLFEHQEKFVIEDPWEAAVERCISTYPEGFVNGDVFEYLNLPAYRQNTKEAKRVNAICQQKGLVKQRYPAYHARLRTERPRVWKC